MRDFDIVIIGFILILVHLLSASETRLDTATNNTRIYINQHLYSPMGLYRMSLQQYSCSFNIDVLQQQNNKSSSTSGQQYVYKIKDIYVSPNYMNSCEYIQVFNGGLIADQKELYVTASSRYNEFSFLIDDNGIYRFIGLGESSSILTYDIPKKLNSAANFPYNFTKSHLPYTCMQDTRFQTKYIENKTYILTFCQFNISQHPQSQKSTINENNWKFTIDNSKTLKIRKIGKQQDQQLSLTYQYGNISLTPNGIQIQNISGLLYSDIKEYIIYPKCSRSLNPLKLSENIGHLYNMKYLKYQAPIQIEIDKYWPIVTVYDANKYTIMKLSPATHQNELIICSEQTFEFEGNCIPECPQSFYYQIWQNKGKCVAQCQFGVTPNAQRICLCASDSSIQIRNQSLIEKCNDKINTRSYPFGCYCTNNTYFDSIFSHSCVSENNCPNKTYPANGLCMKCPRNCQKCSKDKLNLRFLKCDLCRQGYQIYKGLCIASCTQNLDFITSECKQCKIPHCLKCSTKFPGHCLQCSPIYVLQQGVCKLKCSNNYKAVFIKEQFQTVCLKENQNCLQIVSVFYPQFFGSSSPGLSCTRCKQKNQIVVGDICLATISQCSSDMEKRIVNNQNFCICKNKNQVTISGRCYKPYQNLNDRMPLTSLCPIYSFFNYNTLSCQSCPPTCLTCVGNDCTSCPPEHYLHISPFGSKCRLLNPVHLCHLSKGYLSNFKEISNLCVHNTSINTLSCNVQKNCLLCKNDDKQYCILCSKYYFLYNNTCVDQCPLDHFIYGSVCILKQPECEIENFSPKTIQQQVNKRQLFQSEAYKFYNDFGNLPGNDIYTYPLFSKITQFDFQNDINANSTWKTILKTYKKTCIKCRKGYGIDINTHKCIKCPDICSKCHYVDSKNKSNCIISQNSQFQEQQQECGYAGFYNPIKNTCQFSCQLDQKPSFQNGLMVCIPIEDDNQQDQVVTIDGSYYSNPNGNQGNQNIAFFVFNKVLRNIQLPNHKTFINNYSQQLKFQFINKQPRLLQISYERQDNGRQFLQFINASQSIHLNLTKYLPYIQSQSGSFLGNSQYGISSSQSYRHSTTTSLAFVGYILSFIVIILHIIYIGNGILYKIDNLLIFTQSIFFFCFNRLLVGNLLTQFYYGWIYSHAGWFPNLLKYTIPEYYFEPSAPLTYKLVTLDANLIRNAGYSFSILGIFLIILPCILILILILTSLCKKISIWNKQLIYNSIIAFWQFLVTNILYWSITQLLYGYEGKFKNQGFYLTNVTIAIICCGTIGVYAFVRLCYNRFGGIYMIKRIGIITILAFAYEKPYFIAIAIGFQIIFTFLRIIAQQPKICSGYSIIIGQEISLSIAYAILFSVENQYIISIFTTFFVFIWIVIFLYQLIQLYLQSKKYFLSPQIDRKEKQAATQQPRSIKTTDRDGYIASTQRKLRKL